MENIIKDYIYEQNYELLKKIAEDKYNNDIEKQKEFINKYHKKNYSYFKVVTKDSIPDYHKYITKRIKK